MQITAAPSSLWISQIIEEEHESESAAESAGHSRGPSSQQTMLNKDLAQIVSQEQSEPVKVIFNMNEVAERASCPATQYVSSEVQKKAAEKGKDSLIRIEDVSETQ